MSDFEISFNLKKIKFNSIKVNVIKVKLNSINLITLLTKGI